MQDVHLMFGRNTIADFIWLSGINGDLCARQNYSRFLNVCGIEMGILNLFGCKAGGMTAEMGSRYVYCI